MIFALLALLFAAGTNAAAQRLDPGDLQAAGLVRLADLLGMADGWDVVSIDGFTVRGSPPGFPIGERPTVLVVIDGIPVSLDQLGTTSLNRLPLALHDVEHVEIDSHPVIVRGRFAPGGAIRIVTRRPVKSREIRARHVSGSETGDPGPYQFTDRASPNVERIGFDSAITMGGRRSSLWSDASYAFARHYASDEAILPRLATIGGGDARILEKEAPSVRVGWDGSRGEAAAFARASTVDDVFFLRSLGREVPVESSWLDFGLRGGRRLRNSLRVDASGRSTQNELDASERNGRPRLDWRSEERGGDVTLTLSRGEVDASIGLRASHHAVKARRRSIRHDVWGSRAIFAHFARTRPSGSSRFVEAMVEESRGRSAHAFTASQTVQGRRCALDAAFALSRLLPQDSAPFWFWRERGFDVLEDEGVPVEARNRVAGARSIGGDLGFTIGTGSGPRLRLGSFVRVLRDLALEEVRVEGDSAGVTSSTFVSVPMRERGTMLGWTLTGESRLPHGAALRAGWRVQGAASGTALFHAEVESMSAHLARAALSATPFRNFSVQLAFRATSATDWPDYADAAARSSGRYAAHIPAAALVDLSFSKWFARRHVRAGLAFRDLFDRPARTHPIGEIERLTVVVQAELGLGAGS